MGYCRAAAAASASMGGQARRGLWGGLRWEVMLESWGRVERMQRGEGRGEGRRGGAGTEGEVLLCTCLLLPGWRGVLGRGVDS